MYVVAWNREPKGDWYLVLTNDAEGPHLHEDYSDAAREATELGNAYRSVGIRIDVKVLEWS